MAAALQFSEQWFAPNRWQFERHLSSIESQDVRILEIGCFEGQATCWLLENAAKSPSSRIACIDIFEQPTFWSNVEKAGDRRKVDLKIGHSRLVLPTFDMASFDFVFIDGSHAATDVLEDAVLSFRLAKVGAIIAFDDYRWKLSEDRPKAAIDSFLLVYASKIVVLSKNYQVWIRKASD